MVPHRYVCREVPHLTKNEDELFRILAPAEEEKNVEKRTMQPGKIMPV